MKSIEKEKMCISCEGRIPFNAEVCPYCATDQNEGKLHNSFQAPLFQSQSLEDSLTSLYTPPYQGKRPQFAQTTNAPSSSPKAETPLSNFDQEMPMYKEVTERPETDYLAGTTVEGEVEGEKSSLLPTLFLIIGANLFLLGMMQLFFSKNGFLRLEWNANYWFFYCLIGAPLLFFGYKKAKAL